MEEILASIRRIIAEGERDAQEAGGERDRTEPTAPAPSKPPTAETPERGATPRFRSDRNGAG
jgi:cell pole-organizing protein PopZ